MPHRATANSLPSPPEHGKASPVSPLAAALRYAALGWPVFAAHQNKHPIHGYRFRRRGTRWAASVDPDFLRYVFGLNSDALVGIAFGLDARDPRATWMTEAVPATGTFCIDVDVASEGGHDHDGAPKLAALIARHGPLPDTLTSVGLDGGGHLHFRAPPDRRVVSRTLVDELGVRQRGLDVKGEGGYAAEPPSRGRRWLNWGTSIADAPDWLLSLVCEQPREARPPRPEGPRLARTVPKRREVPTIQPVAVMPSPEILEMMRQNAGRGISTRFEDLKIEDLALKMEYALDAIPNETFEYDEWLPVMAAIFDGLGDAGEALWHDFSRRSPKYDEDFTQLKWDRERGRLASITVAKIFHLATIHDPDGDPSGRHIGRARWHRAYMAELEKNWREGKYDRRP